MRPATSRPSLSTLVDHDITLVSAWAINAIPVAEMCLAQILLSLRGYFQSVHRYHELHDTATAKRFTRPGVADETIGLIGMGYIGTRLRHLLRDYPLEVIAHDPMLTTERATELDVELVELATLFSRSFIVSNHIPDLPSTRGKLGASLFAAMRDGASFINTGRGAQVVEADLIAVLKDRVDLTALLDVSWPEPPADDLALWTLAQCGDQPTHRRHHWQRGDAPRGLRDRGIRSLELRPAAALPGHRDVLRTMG